MGHIHTLVLTREWIAMLATDMCLSWPKVLNLVTVRGFMKTPV